MSDVKITRPVLRYYGSKWALAPWIIAHFPVHHSYVELFGGGGAVLLRKAPSPIEVYNDADGQIVNFFRMVRERPAELVALLDATPYARAELDLAYEPTDDPLEAARRLFVRMWQGHGGSRATWRTGWRYQRNANQRRSVVANWRQHDRLLAVAERFKDVQIECADALTVIRRFDTAETLFYADPPYLADLRSERWGRVGYGEHELDEDGHRALAEALNNIEGMAIVSGYPSPLYDELYRGWGYFTQDVAVDGRVHRSSNGKQRRRTEALWVSPAALARARRVSMFAEGAL